MTDLFTIPESPSPRLAWLRKHNVHTFCSGPAEHFDGEPWNCWQAINEKAMPEDYETGTTEHEAIVKWAIAHNVPLWNEEGLKK